MKGLEKLVKSRIYNGTVNLLILLSLVFLVVEKFLDLGVISYGVLFQIDVVIMAVFLGDFFLRLLAGGGTYFAHDYGWLDFLAAVPILVPMLAGGRALRSLRAIRVLRVLRLLRMVRILKVYSHAALTEVHHRQIVLPAAAFLMICLVTAGGVMISGVESILTDRDEYQEQLILSEYEEYPSVEARKIFLKNQERVIRLIDYTEVIEDPELAKLSFRAGDTFVRKMDGFYAVFSRKESRREINRWEGWLYMAVFFISGGVGLILSNRLDKIEAESSS